MPRSTVLVTSADDHEGVALLRRFHAEVAVDCIPEEELEGCDEWEVMLHGRKGMPAFEAILLTDDGDGATPTPRIVGGVTYEVYPNSGVPLLTYLCVRQDCRGQGLGRLLCEACLERLPQTDHLVLEAHLPTVADAVMDPVQRLRIYTRLGFSSLSPALEYTAPSISPGTPNVPGLQLLVKPRGAACRRMPTATLAAFLPEYWGACYAVDTQPLDSMLAWCAARSEADLVDPPLC